MPIGFEDVLFVLLLVLIGIIAGYVGGLFGVGGGTILVPFFLTIFPFFHSTHGVVMHNAIGTSLALLIPNTLISALKQYKLGNVDFKLLSRWTPFIVIGCIVGVSVVKFIPTLYLKIIFAVYLYISFLFVAIKKSAESDVGKSLRGFWIYVLAFLTGGFSVLLGMGGGTFTVPICHWYDYPMRKAVAISSATGVFIGVIGTIGVIISGWGVPGRTPYSLGFVNIIAFIVVLPSIVFFSPKGVNRANKISKNKLRQLYSALLLFIAIYMTGSIFFDY